MVTVTVMIGDHPSLLLLHLLLQTKTMIAAVACSVQVRGGGAISFTLSCYHIMLICLILANGAPRHLPAYLLDNRQMSRVTPACSSARSEEAHV